MLRTCPCLVLGLYSCAAYVDGGAASLVSHREKDGPNVIEGSEEVGVYLLRAFFVSSTVGDLALTFLRSL